MDMDSTASELLSAVGGKQNIIANSVCMTRLRLSLQDLSRIDISRLSTIKGVLGVVSRGTHGIEVVFGPALIDEVYCSFAALTELGSSHSGHGSASESYPGSTPCDSFDGFEDGVADNPVPGDEVTPAADDGPTGGAITEDEAAHLRELIGSSSYLDRERNAGPVGKGRHLLVINGPNINMLGVREPTIYGRQDYASLVKLCKDAGEQAGFSEVRCVQSNHEGDLVDEIQAAWNVMDGIVINPAAFTHTSVALLDALKAVGIPTVEVHISKVESREDFRQVSYVRAACFETITGLGLDGYRKAIFDLAAHLDDEALPEDEAAKKAKES